MMGKRVRGRMDTRAGAMRYGIRGARVGTSRTLRGLGLGGVARRAASGVLLAGTVATSTTAATLRLARSTRQAGRDVRAEATRRARAVACAARGGWPRRWPIALGAFGVGLGMGVASGYVASSVSHRHDDGMRTEGPAAGVADPTTQQVGEEIPEGAPHSGRARFG